MLLVEETVTDTGIAERTSNLPLQPSPLIGRNEDRATARELLLDDEVRLLSLTGPAGVGKSRLALSIAEDLLAEWSQIFPDGIWSVDLAAVENPDHVPAAIAQITGLFDAGEPDAADRVIRMLQPWRLLLVLDGFDHVLPATAYLADLLGACPRMKVLVTSRERLRLPWEHALIVPPLAVPDQDHTLDPATLGQAPAAALFVQSARAVVHDFTLSDANCAAVGELCRRLDGLPLALELAATHVDLLPPAALLGRLDRHLSLPGWNGAGALECQPTIDAEIRRSYVTLSGDEQALFRCFGVFRGGWTLEAAEALSESNELLVDPLHAMSRLIDKSLIQVLRQADGTPRFGMLETYRRFAIREMIERDELESAHRQHALISLECAERAAPELFGPQQGTWLDLLESEHDNVEAALHWLAERGEAERLLRLAAAYWRYWGARGHLKQGRAWLDRALSAPVEGMESARIEALIGCGMLTAWLGDADGATERLSEAVNIAGVIGDDRLMGRALTASGMVCLSKGEDSRGLRLSGDGLALCRAAGDQWGTAFALRTIGRCQLERAVISRTESRPVRAILDEALRLSRAIGEQQAVAVTRGMLAALTASDGDIVTGIGLFRESLTIARDARDPIHMGVALHDMATHLAPQLPPHLLLRLHGAQMAWEAASGVTGNTEIDHRWSKAVDTAYRSLGESARAAEVSAGNAMSLNDAVGVALDALTSLEADVQRNPVRSIKGGKPDPRLLSRREAEVLAHVAEGLTNQQIADELTISE